MSTDGCGCGCGGTPEDPTPLYAHRSWERTLACRLATGLTNGEVELLLQRVRPNALRAFVRISEAGVEEGVPPDADAIADAFDVALKLGAESRWFRSAEAAVARARRDSPPPNPDIVRVLGQMLDEKDENAREEHDRSWPPRRLAASQNTRARLRARSDARAALAPYFEVESLRNADPATSSTTNLRLNAADARMTT